MWYSPADVDKPNPCPVIINLHSVPSSIKAIMTRKYPLAKSRTRFVFRQWPRDPNGKLIKVPNDIHGKEAGNGLKLWGETLYDFYFVHRIPTDPGRDAVTTRLANIMTSLGELDHDEIAQASREAEPMEIPGWSPAQAIVAHERRIQCMFWHRWQDEHVCHSLSFC